MKELRFKSGARITFADVPESERLNGVQGTEIRFLVYIEEDDVTMSDPLEHLQYELQGPTEPPDDSKEDEIETLDEDEDDEDEEDEPEEVEEDQEDTP